MSGLEQTATSSSGRRFTAHERFRVELAEDLRNYVRRLGAADADLLLAISRKSPRLLRLIADLDELPGLDLSRCISEKALPFIPRESLRGKRILVTDDTIVYGSTFAKNVTRLSAAGATVVGEVLALSKSANPRIFEFVGDGAPTLDESRIQQLIDLEIQAFGALAVPYDIDHPVLTLPFDGDEPDLVDRLERHNPGAWRPTNAWHEAHGVTVVSLPIPEAVTGAHSQATRRLGPLKLRLFIDAGRRATRAVAIFAVALRENELHDQTLFDRAPAPLARVWRTLVSRVEEAAWPARDQHLALANAAHYLSGCEALWLWLAGGGLGIQSGRATLSAPDLRLLFGPTVTVEVHEQLELFLADAARQQPPSAPAMPPTPADRLDIDAELDAFRASERGQLFLRQVPKYLALAAPYDPGDLIHSFFNAQRRVYDELTRRETTFDFERLAAGLLPFPTIVPLLHELGAAVGEHDLERFADKAIDGGSVVPHYHPALSAPELWLRSVRAGERGTQKLKHWLHRCVVHASKSYARTHRVPADRREDGLPWYVSEKLFAVLAGVMSTELRLELGEHVACGRDQFGARAELPELPRKPYLLDWGVDAGLLRRRRRPGSRRSGATFRGDFVTASPEFRELYPEALDTVDRDLRHVSQTVIDAFIALDAAFEGQRRDIAILAISSCGSHDAYLCSLSAEIEAFLHNRRFNAARLATELVAVADRTEQAERVRQVNAALDAARTALAQAGEKKRAYQGRVAVRDALDELCERDDLLAAHASAWQLYIRPLIDDAEVPRSRCEDYLLHAAELGEVGVQLATEVLMKFGLAPVPRGRTAHDVATCLESFERVTEDGKAALLIYPRPAVLDRDSLLSGDLARALAAAADVLRDIEAAVESIWTTWRRPEAPNALAPVGDDRVVLIWDVAGSSDDADGVQETIHRVNQRIERDVASREEAHFSPDQDDGQAVVVRTVSDALELFRIAAEMFESSGHHIRAGIETTRDGHELLRNRESGHFGGRAYVLAARAMTAFAEVGQGNATATGWHENDELATAGTIPTQSYVIVTERALKQLREAEAISEPAALTLFGEFRDYVPRVGGSLSTDLSCYVCAASRRAAPEPPA